MLLRHWAWQWLPVLVVVCVLILALEWVDLLSHADQVVVGSQQLFMLLLFKLPALINWVWPLVLGVALMLMLEHFVETHEAVAWVSLGVGPGALFRLLWPGVAVAFLVALASSCYLEPWAARAQARYLKHAVHQLRSSEVPVGRFFPVGHEQWLGYVGARHHHQLAGVLLLRPLDPKDWRLGVDVMRAERLGLEGTEQGQVRLRVLHGERLTGVPGSGDFRQVAFEALTHEWAPKPLLMASPLEGLSLSELYALRHVSAAHQALWQWRLTSAWMAWGVTLWVLLLWPFAARRGVSRQGWVFLGLLAYPLLMMEVRESLAVGQGVGLVWVHLGWLVLLLILAYGRRKSEG